MAKQILEETREIAVQIEEQLKFYRDIGISSLEGATAPGTATLAESGVLAVPAITAPPLAFDAAETAPESTPTSRVQPAGPVETPQARLDVLFGETVRVSESVISRTKSASLPVLEISDASLEAIREDIGDCRRCKLHERRRTIVFGEGNTQAKLVFVGEGPGAEEDSTGRPFVGRAGQLLNKIIVAIGLKREDVYIANIVKCRPPNNRPPEREEVDTCEPFLFRQLAFIKPKVIVALGSPAFQCLARTRESISRARGEWRDLNGIRLMPTFHPAFLLRSPDKKREVWEDMKKVRDYLNESRD